MRLGDTHPPRACVISLLSFFFFLIHNKVDLFQECNIKIRRLSVEVLHFNRIKEKRGEALEGCWPWGETCSTAKNKFGKHCLYLSSPELTCPG